MFDVTNDVFNYVAVLGAEVDDTLVGEDPNKLWQATSYITDGSFLLFNFFCVFLLVLHITLSIRRHA